MKNGEPFSYFKSEKDSWDCRRVYDDDLKQNILSLFNKKNENNDLSLWFKFSDINIKNINISLTRYYDGRFLELHKDTTSSLTTVIVLTDDFSDGRFVLSEKYNKNILVNKDMVVEHLGIGQGISFNGSEIFHGVLPVKSGIRCALNVWMNETDFSFDKPIKKLI
jgi:predicted 2-oxoglutarate/Fe(II)-dependent dioxygenase YbiX